MFRAKTALVTVLVLLSCVSMQAQKADVFGTLVTGKANNPVSNADHVQKYVFRRRYSVI